MIEMPQGETFSRSRSGCLQCRKKHNKCDEQQPKCSFCAVRDLNCKYPSNIKWIQRAQSTLTRHKPRCREIRRTEVEPLAQSPALFADTCFESTEEKSAWEYYVRLVSSNVPALDGPDNPYRRLSIPALSSPILLETIICIATEHMLNFGLTSIDLAARRQQRMLRTLGQNLISMDADINSNPVAITTINKGEREALLAAVVLQGIVVAQTADGVLEPHVKCASWLMEALGYFEEIPQNPIARMIIQRFGMVDLMLAISRQRRPYAPQNFILNQPNQAHWDTTEPSFYEMTGCPHPLMCFLVRISHLACNMGESLESKTETDTETESEANILASAFELESELRAWGTEYKYDGKIPAQSERTPLDILSECFYWTAHLLLARRVFRDQTCSPRVQHLVHICFGLMDHLSTGCGPDSSLPQPFYLAAREAVSPEDRAWVRQKHESMTAYYREQQRNSAMGLIEQIWEVTDSLREMEGGVARSASDRKGSGFSIVDGYVQALDRGSCFFII
ncbi:transcriptional regulator family: Fungal Specific TF [Penicillium nucicola]|uniref:transcriptional regulator family: Fungal Specific TF n=1 Tax=Penicillium nucicola TaxID=1850975 RepID=UPI002545ABF8|nr:transcriptional regulator family: Fungal Specific TF [Penicillium nucicola]KAJ5776096.1 transcriptional regulator family: Fungal Specific TF [Penicillium nucicola]